MSDWPSRGTPFGEMLRGWRRRRRLTQLDLSIAADVSTKHLSFLETGKATPSREMVLDLAEHLDVPLRERNLLLNAAGFAPLYPRRSLDDPDMQVVQRTIDQVLRGHEPYPAIAVDRYWNILAMNSAAPVFTQEVDPEVLGPQLNSYRIALHPRGMAAHVVNFPEFAHHLLSRLRHDAAVSADPDLTALLEEVESYPNVRELSRATVDPKMVLVPLRLRHPRGELAMFTTITTFGTAVDVTIDELALETFFPADTRTARRLSQLAERHGGVALQA